MARTANPKVCLHTFLSRSSPLIVVIYYTVMNDGITSAPALETSAQRLVGEPTHLPREQVYHRGNTQHMITEQRHYSGETRGARCVTPIQHAGTV